jgi:metal transporter CNNM
VVYIPHSDLFLTSTREIIDESDVYIDVHKAIRRLAPAPKARVQKGHIVGNTEAPYLHAPEDQLIDLSEDGPKAIEITKTHTANSRDNSPAAFGTSPKTTFMRRNSSADGVPILQRGNANDMREHLKHLGPSNLASRPKTTRYQTVKIKPGHLPGRSDSRTDSTLNQTSIIEEPYEDIVYHGGEGEGLLRSAGQDAKDGVQALQQGYGSMDRAPNQPNTPRKLSKSEHAQVDELSNSPDQSRSRSRTRASARRQETDQISIRSSDTLGTLPSRGNSPTRRKTGAARSGSLTENLVDAGGIRKMVLETTSSGEGDDRDSAPSSREGKKSASTSPKFLSNNQNGNGAVPPSYESLQLAAPEAGEEVKKKAKKRKRNKKAKNNTDGTPNGEGSATQ